MKSLPVAPSCSLDADGLRAQLERYRRAGEGAEVVSSSARGFRLRLAAATDLDAVADAIAIERECCPFYEIAWDPAERLLSFAVSSDEHEPALGAISDALQAGRLRNSLEGEDPEAPVSDRRSKRYGDPRT